MHFYLLTSRSQKIFKSCWETISGEFINLYQIADYNIDIFFIFLVFELDIIKFCKTVDVDRTLKYFLKPKANNFIHFWLCFENLLSNRDKIKSHLSRHKLCLYISNLQFLSRCSPRSRGVVIFAAVWWHSITSLQMQKHFSAQPLRRRQKYFAHSVPT